jgi:GTP-binding protein
MLVDEITIRIEAGKGGDGIVSFNKNKMTLGPSGGSGGLGGSVYCIGVSDLGALNSLRNQKVFKAEDGKRGRHQLNDGTDGEDLTIRVPVGTVIHNLTTGTDKEIVQIGEKLLVAKGGRGGKGNFHYRGPHHTSPTKFQHGLPGVIFNFKLELKMIADIGLIGLPNAGKSSLINELTRANSKVANYPFTTLEPHLGVYYDLILADIPGLIEGASDGKGLGIKFLRHVERTKVLFHLVSAESSDPAADYIAIRNELEAYNKEMLKKKEYLFLSKVDLVDQVHAKKQLAKLKKLNKNASLLSVHDPDAIASVQKLLNGIADEKHAPQE